MKYMQDKSNYNIRALKLIRFIKVRDKRATEKRPTTFSDKYSSQTANRNVLRKIFDAKKKSPIKSAKNNCLALILMTIVLFYWIQKIQVSFL